MTTEEAWKGPQGTVTEEETLELILGGRGGVCEMIGGDKDIPIRRNLRTMAKMCKRAWLFPGPLCRSE